jgi:glycosyltransferase involved in cell wall biosynthesis
VSNTTKQDLIDFYNYPSHKISVIYHWYSLPELNTTLPLYLPEKYLLYIGERGGYKNFLFLARALKNIFEKHVDLRLLCTGREFSNEEKIFFSTLGIAENIIHIFSEDSDLPYIYRHASALIFPSLYEGFGIPLLEATQNNCPLILSNITVFQEITKGKARFFYPKSANSIIQTISDHLDAQIRVLPFDMNIFNSAISIQKHIEVYNDLI